MRAAADRLYEGKHETLGGFGSEKIVVAGVQEVADEKPERGLGANDCASPAPKTGLATGNLPPEPGAAQAPAGFPFSAVAAQVTHRQSTNPRRGKERTGHRGPSGPRRGSGR